METWLSYVFLILAVVCIVGQFLITKLYQRSVRQALITSLFFVLLSSLVTLIIFFVYNGFQFGGITSYSLLLALVSSAIMIVYNVISIKILGLGEVSIYSMFMMLGGMIVPFVEGLIVNPETNRLKLTNGLGLVLLTFFLIFQVAGVKTARSTRKKFYALCIVMFFINGIVGVLTSLQSNPVAPAMTSENFTILKSLIMIVLSAAIIGILLLGKKSRAANVSALRTALAPRPVVFGTICSAVAGIGGFLQLVANAKVPNTVQYPIVTGGTIVLTAVAAFLFFREKQSRRSTICLAGAFLSTILFVF